MTTIRETDVGVKNVPLRKKAKGSFKGKKENKIGCVFYLKERFSFKGCFFFKGIRPAISSQVIPSAIEGFLKEQLLKESRHHGLKHWMLKELTDRTGKRCLED